MTHANPNGPRLQRWLVVLVLAFVVPLAWLKPLDGQAEAQLKDGLGRALATYAVARTINGVVSVLQETGVSVQPAGIGMTFAPGQVLDPLNDMVEQFSGVMLAVCTSFAMQLALLKIGGTSLVSLGLSLVLLWWAFTVWHGRALAAWQSRLVIAALLVRFAVPLAASASELTYQHTLEQEYTSSQQGLQATVADVQSAAPAQDLKTDQDVAPDESWIERFRKLPDALRNFETTRKLRDLLGVDSAVQQAKAKYEQIKARLDSAVQDMVRVIAIFALQTVLLPLLFLWLTLQILRRLVASPQRSL